MHRNFDMYGFGKAIKRILRLTKVAENILYTDYA